jgi:mutator protein MutT
VPRLSDGVSLPVVTDHARRQMTVFVVAAAVVEREGRILVTKRQPGVHLEGHWEFPGGKCAPDETLERCLVRELREELAVEVIVGSELLATSHDYGERRVELHFFTCRIQGEPYPQLGQEMQWVARSDLRALLFPPADAQLIALLTTGVTE